MVLTKRSANARMGVVTCAAYTDWAEIAGLCGLLERQTASPVVKLNRAAAVAMADNIGGALVLLEELSSDSRLERYYLLEATRADLLRRQGNQAGADVAGHAGAAAGAVRGRAPDPDATVGGDRQITGIGSAAIPAFGLSTMAGCWFVGRVVDR